MTDDTTRHDHDSGGVDAPLDPDPEPPRVQKERPITTHTHRGGYTAGYVAGSPNRAGRLFIATRSSEHNRIRALEAEAGGAYAIRLDVLRGLRDFEDVATVLIHERDTGTVYEWPLNAFTARDGDWRAVPDEYLDTPDEPQAYVTRASAAHTWDMRARDLYVVDDDLGGFD